MDLTHFEVLTFDCYGTLIDWETGLLAALRPWRTRCGVSASDEELLNTFGRFEAQEEAATPEQLYPDILRAVLTDLAGHYGVTATDAELQAFGASVGDWPAFPDSPAALQYLQQHYKLAILSNVDRTSFAFSEARLGVHFDLVVTAEDVGSYKPERRNFERILADLKNLGISRDRVLHVAQSLFHDHVPAKALGLPTVWVNRRAGRAGWGATKAPTGDVQPDLVVPNMAGLAAAHRAAAG